MKNNVAHIGSERIESNAALRQVPIGIAETLAFLSFINAPSPLTLKELVASRRAATATLLYSVSEKEEA